MTNTFWQPLHAGRVALIALMFPIAFGLARAGEVDKWIDDKGEIHYSDTPPAGVNAQRVPRLDTHPAGVEVRRIPQSDPIIIPGTTPPDSTTDAGSASMEDQQDEAAAQAYAERRQEMIEDCEQNNGIDCEREVDTELGAEDIQRSGHVIHQIRPH
jgi:hypothetical protein